MILVTFFGYSGDFITPVNEAGISQSISNDSEHSGSAAGHSLPKSTSSLLTTPPVIKSLLKLKLGSIN